MSTRAHSLSDVPQSCLRLGSLVVITLIDLSGCSRVTGYQTRDPITMQTQVSWEDRCKSGFIASLCHRREESPHKNPFINLIVSSSNRVLGEDRKGVETNTFWRKDLCRKNASSDWTLLLDETFLVLQGILETAALSFYICSARPYPSHRPLPLTPPN